MSGDSVAALWLILLDWSVLSAWKQQQPLTRVTILVKHCGRCNMESAQLGEGSSHAVLCCCCAGAAVLGSRLQRRVQTQTAATEISTKGLSFVTGAEGCCSLAPIASTADCHQHILPASWLADSAAAQ